MSDESELMMQNMLHRIDRLEGKVDGQFEQLARLEVLMTGIVKGKVDVMWQGAATGVTAMGALFIALISSVISVIVDQFIRH